MFVNENRERVGREEAFEEKGHGGRLAALGKFFVGLAQVGYYWAATRPRWSQNDMSSVISIGNRGIVCSSVA